MSSASASPQVPASPGSGRLLPTTQADRVREALTGYLKTTFSLAEKNVQSALDAFLSDPDNGIFRGPYVRTRTPFKPSPGGQDVLDISTGEFDPYGHQAAAFARLSSKGLEPAERPAPTLVTTGTGSGKTESFLFPILDHVVRHRRAGGRGISALILYPMNALAMDQAQRLAEMISESAEYGHVRAAMYVGDQGDKRRTKVDPEGLINDRETIRQDPPDILLTNYKMLDQLLLRTADQKLWEESALSLQYLVLDEFHTYDGAQGTDVAMLLRRLGLKLKSYWSTAADPRITTEHRDRPLGRITPVATSATLGDKNDPGQILHFAQTVFGEEFSPDAVVTESRYTVDEWAALYRDSSMTEDSVVRFADLDVPDLASRIDRTDVAGEKAAIAAAALFTGDGDVRSDNAPSRLLGLFASHPDIRRLAALTETATRLDDLARDLFPSAERGPRELEHTRTVLTAIIAALSLVRAETGRKALTVDVHLWVRELSRIDRVAGGDTEFRWFDDGQAVSHLGGTWDENSSREAFPALYCRNCNRSGWGVLLGPVNNGLAPETQDSDIRGEHANGNGRFRALLYAENEAEAYFRNGPESGDNHPRLRVFDTENRQLTSPDPAYVDYQRFDRQPPSDDIRESFAAGNLLPVLVQDEDEKARQDVCPFCEEKDSIRFLGSAVATMLSVTLSSMFGSADLREDEKKSLVFTDSVQDSAHRAGFIESRSHALTLRNVIAGAVPAGGTTLDRMGNLIVEAAGDQLSARHRMLPAVFAQGSSFPAVTQWWQQPRKPNPAGHELVERRLRFDATLEFGTSSQLGRTLERTGTITAEVDLPEDHELDNLTRAVFAETEFGHFSETPEGADHAPEAPARRTWVRGVVEHLRAQGGIHHEWLLPYIREGGTRYRIWGGRAKHQGMPAFPRGRSAPRFAMTGKSQKGRPGGGPEILLDFFEDPRTWYARYTARTLQVTPSHGGGLVKRLFTELATRSILQGESAKDGTAKVFGLPASRIRLFRGDDVEGGEAWVLRCTVCSTEWPAGPRTVEHLDGSLCMMVSCSGRMVTETAPRSFYRDLYTSPGMRRIVAREHSSILEATVRKEYEDGFKRKDQSPADPNVLVATPTLEMGIDIGDLSTVVLASLPRTVASYVQRVGRAGRKTGNALDLTFVQGRGETLPKIGDPTSVINGSVQPPATYLDAAEIIKRQYVGFLVDTLAREGGDQPSTPAEALGSTAEGSFLGRLIALNAERGEELVEAFLRPFAGLVGLAAAELRTWAVETSGLSEQVYAACTAYTREIEELKYRRQTISDSLPALRTAAENTATATEDDEKAYRSAQSALWAVEKALAAARNGGHDGSGYWISALESAGLLPNYTLLDESVELDVALHWKEVGDLGGEEFRKERVSIERGARQALRDFAPGSTFYGRGLEVRIDAVDIGHQGEDLYTLAFCAQCGYTHDSRPGRGASDVQDGTGSAAGEGASGAVVPAVCPRCGDAGIADVGQHVPAIELTKVSALVNRDENRISDRDDERKRRMFTVVSTADIAPRGIADRWYVKDYGLGVSYLSSVRIVTTNLGAKGESAEIMVAGAEVGNTRFRICEACGQLDSAANVNTERDHRPWCPHRKSPDEHSVGVVLTHELDTQGALLRLPAGLLEGETMALPSLEAAIRLGLREHLGGDPDHIAVMQTTEPQSGGGVADALLLHDTVPGGTGYLADLATPGTLWGVLQKAHEIVRACECQHDDAVAGRMACQKCILPYINRDNTGLLSRAVAEQMLEELLRGGRSSGGEDPVAELPVWSVQQEQPEDIDPESYLERTFRRVLKDRLTSEGFHIHEEPSQDGTIVRFARDGSNVRWALEPQPKSLRDSAGTVPDFFLRQAPSTLPWVALAIYTDGKKFHASSQYNNVAADAGKRTRSRAQRYPAIALTLDDVQGAVRDGGASGSVGGAAAGGADGGFAGSSAGGGGALPWWYDGQVAQKLQGDGKWPAETQEFIKNPMEMLLALISRATSDEKALRTALRKTVDTLPEFLVRSGKDLGIKPKRAWVEGSADHHLVGSGGVPGILLGTRKALPEGTKMNGVYLPRAPLGILVHKRVVQGGTVDEIGLVLDDRVETMTSDPEAFDRAWREWLHLSNLLHLRHFLVAGTQNAVGSVLGAGSVDAGAGDVSPVSVADIDAPVPDGVPVEGASGAVEDTVSARWRDAVSTLREKDEIVPAEASFLEAFFGSGIEELPAFVEETDDGTAVPIMSWSERKVAVLYEDEETAEDVAVEAESLRSSGWTVIVGAADSAGADVTDRVKAALAGVGTSATGSADADIEGE
ncbi:DEAD/DEAH box helicase [Brevibacterium litoralis]|uniref:DEAD/DEAH box helicase n=1 Tax=Brevibacterium litoralis TaxID=3138935 RepID=UPI0032EAF5B9